MDHTRGNTLVLLGTGGTISGRATRDSDNLGYATGQVGVEELASGVQRVDADPMTLVTEQIAQIDSKDMDVPVWRDLARRCAHHLGQPSVRGVVITHGTDTMEESAFLLHALLQDAGARNKPVVLTGAIRPASSLSPDGPQNLRDALAVAARPDARGVLVVMAGTVFAGAVVQKVHGYRLHAFEAAEGGPLGYVEEGAVRMVHGWPTQEHAQSGALAAVLDGPLSWPRVEIVLSHAAADGLLVDALLAQSASGSVPLRGLVVAGTGNGTLHLALHAALLRARDQGVVVVRSTRCSRGRVLPIAADVFADSRGLPPVKARIALMLSLMRDAATQAKPGG